MRCRQATARFVSEIGTAEVTFYVALGTSVKMAVEMAEAMQIRIYDGRRCEVVSISVGSLCDVVNEDCIMHMPKEN